MSSSMTAILELVAPALLLAAGAAVSSPLRSRHSYKVMASFSIVASIIMLYLSINSLIHGYSEVVTIGWESQSAIPWPLLRFRLGIDSLTSFFMLIEGIVGLAVSIYSINYLDVFREVGLRSHSINYPLTMAFMYLVLITRNLFLFLIFWELMTLTSQFLVSSARRPESVKAGLKYFALTKGLAEFMIAGGVFFMVLSSGSANYSVISHYLRWLEGVNPELAAVPVTLMIAGFMVKSTLVPAHAWAPDAYSEAPSNVSALMSGVMSKLGIYMMFRVLLYFIKPSLAWGAFLSGVGAMTLVYGTMNALRQTDSKRLLSYHSIGQLGYVTLGLGACLTLLSVSPPHPLLASIAALASLYHALNHSLFKPLLFLTAGSAEYVTGSKDLNRLGGLGKLMPVTAATALIGSLSISGVPPFNGFVSKWMIYSSTLTSGGFLTACGFAALFISSVTTASFIKYYTSLFGRPGKLEVKGVKEVPASMIAGEVILASLCVVMGVAPIAAWVMALPVVRELISTSPLSNAYITPLFGVAVPGVSVNSPLLFAAVIAPAMGAAAALSRVRGGRHVLRYPWACGARPLIKDLSAPGRSYYLVFEEEYPWIYRIGSAIHRALAIKLPKALLKALRTAQAAAETPSPMTACMAYALAAAAAALIALLVVKP